jgi:hypothetical protein
MKSIHFQLNSLPVSLAGTLQNAILLFLPMQLRLILEIHPSESRGQMSSPARNKAKIIGIKKATS